MDAVIDYDKAAGFLKNPPSLEPRPNFTNILALQKHIVQALAQLSCSQSPIHGWSGLTMDPAAYLLLEGAAFTIPPLTFTLVVDDIGVKFVDKADVDHLISSIRTTYTLTEDRTGNLYCGITLDWDYVGRTVDISMPGYIKKKLQEYEHVMPKRVQQCPYSPEPKKFGTEAQSPLPPDSTPKLELLPPPLTRCTLLHNGHGGAVAPASPRRLRPARDKSAGPLYVVPATAVIVLRELWGKAAT
jgi:hypothetical protein